MEEVKIFENGELRDISNATWTNKVAKEFIELSFSNINQNFEQVDNYFAEMYPDGVSVEEISKYIEDNYENLIYELDMHDPEMEKTYYDDREETYMENVYYSRK